MKMRLVNSIPHAVIVCCIVCGKRCQSNQEKLYADLDGKAFVDYYCESCKNTAEAKQ